MQTEIIISGFGGQGALFAGQLLAYAAMDAGKHVTWIPSYGPEMRGGTAHCTIIVADDDIGSPLVRYPGAVIVMNMPSFDKYEAQLVPQGVLVINTSLTTRAVQRDDLHVVPVPANTIAEELGNGKMANVVLLGALVAATNVLPLAVLEQALRDHLPAKHRALLDANLEALRRGAALAQAAQTA